MRSRSSVLAISLVWALLGLAPAQAQIAPNAAQAAQYTGLLGAAHRGAVAKLRTLLGMLHSNGFEHFRSLDESRQADYLWTCMEYADWAYDAMLASDGLKDEA